MKKVGWGGKIFLVALLVFMYFPIFVLMFFSFNSTKSQVIFEGFSLRWYENLFNNSTVMNALWNTLILAGISSTAATVLGTAAAVGIASFGKKSKSAIMSVTYMPIINPEIVTGVSLMLLFVFFKNVFGIPLGFFTVLLAHITFNLPYVILNVMPKLRQLDPSLFEAAQDLGCSRISAFFKAVIPELMPGIVAGFLMAFTFSLDDFIVTYFTNGSLFETLPTVIYTMTRKRVSPQINALSTIIFVIVIAVLIVYNIISANHAKKLKAEIAK